MKKLAIYNLTMTFWKTHFCALKKNLAQNKLDFFTIILKSQLILYNTKNYSLFSTFKKQLNRYNAPF